MVAIVAESFQSGQVQAAEEAVAAGSVSALTPRTESVIVRLPRSSAIRPVRTSSQVPYASSIASSASSLAGLLVASSTSVAGFMSTTFARNTAATSSSWPRSAGAARTARRHGTALQACSRPAPTGCACSSAAHLPARGRALLVGAELRAQHDIVIGAASRDHREHALTVMHPEVDYRGHAGDGEGLVEHRVDLVGPVAAQPDAAVGLSELDIVRNGRAQVDLGVPLLVEQLLPLAHHAEEAVVEDQDLDRRPLDRAGRQLLRGHLEAAVTVDRDDKLAGPADLRAHGGRDGEAHRA